MLVVSFGDDPGNFEMFYSVTAKQSIIFIFTVWIHNEPTSYIFYIHDRAVVRFLTGRMPDFRIERMVWLATSTPTTPMTPKKRSSPLFTIYKSINSSFIAQNHLADLWNTYLIRFWYKYFKKVVFFLKGCCLGTYAWHKILDY